jgi:hypothetical protein
MRTLAHHPKEIELEWHPTFLAARRIRSRMSTGNRKTPDDGCAGSTENYFVGVFFPEPDVADISQIAEAVIGRAVQSGPRYGVQLLLTAGNQR